MKSPSGVQGQSRGGGLGVKPPEAIPTMKYCAYKNWFLCNICLYLLLKHALKLKRHTVGRMMYPARGVWIGDR